jgi:hypothetical protein
MGVCSPCCGRAKKNTIGDDRAALPAGGRIRVVRNEAEDPRAPLLVKRREEPKEEAFTYFESFVADLSISNHNSDIRRLRRSVFLGGNPKSSKQTQFII